MLEETAQQTSAMLRLPVYARDLDAMTLTAEGAGFQLGLTMILHKLPFLLSLILAFALVRAPCLAHAALISASPQDGATVPSGEVVIQLRFNSRIDSKLSRLTLLKAADQSVVQPLETSPVSEGLKARAPDLGAGAYTLEWQILSLDGHLTQGRLNFRVER